MNQFPKDILIDVSWLNEHRLDPNLVLVDVRGAGYRLGHIPDAIALNLGRDFFVMANRFVELASPEQIAQGLGALGIANASTIILYDDTNDQLVALVYWLLRYIGHTAIKILHGGWLGWRNAGGEISQTIPQVARAQYRAQTQNDLRATAEWIQANAARADVLVLDARSLNEYKMGHIPNAVNLPYDQNLDWQTMRFRDEAILRAQFEAIGVTPDKEMVVYCHSGMRSAHMFLTLCLMGYARVRNYNGSMADWFENRRLLIEY